MNDIAPIVAVSAPPVSPAEQLRQLIAAEEHTEVQCQPFLRHANALLIDEPTRIVRDGIREQPGIVGRSDYFVVCEGLERQDRSNRIWLWEAKSPQHYIFEVETQNRLCPSPALVSAENQLHYYHYELSSNQQWLARYGVHHPAEVLLGGVIIGRSDRLVKPKRGIDLDDAMIERLYVEAKRVRETYVYRQNRIRLMTWDRILDYIDRPAPVVGQVVNGGEAMPDHIVR